MSFSVKGYIQKQIFVSLVLMLGSACNNIRFNRDIASVWASSTISFVVNEDTVLNDKIELSSILSKMNLKNAKGTIKITGQPSQGVIRSFDSSTGTFSYLPKENFFGEDEFSIEISIQSSELKNPLVNSQKVYITVRPVNDAPALIKGEVGVTSENGGTDITLSATDVDDTVFKFEILSSSNGGVLTKISEGKYSYIPKCGFQGTESISARVTDPSGASDQGMVTVRVLPESDTVTLNRSLLQETVLNDDLKNYFGRCVATSGNSQLSVLTNPTRGVIQNINSSQISYSYRPNSGFWGGDSVLLLLKNDAYQKKVLVNFQVTHVNVLPKLAFDTFEVYQKSNLVFKLSIIDPDDAAVQTFLTTSRANRITTGLGGTLEVLVATNELKYTPPNGLKNVTDFITLYLVDSSGTYTPANIKINILPNPILELKPGLAVRGISCTMCHSQMNANVISDFGHGSSFAQQLDFPDSSGTSRSGWQSDPYKDSTAFVVDSTKPYSDPSTLTVLDRIKVWESGQILKSLIVPNAIGAAGTGGLFFKDYFQSLRPKFYDLVFLPHGTSTDIVSGALGGTSLAPAGNFGSVSSYNEIYIGAPTAADITKKLSNQFLMHEIQGTSQNLGWKSGTAKPYFTNLAGSVSCEGDIIVKGTVLLNFASIATTTGCRIYATGPIFVQGNTNIFSPTADQSMANLQLSSSVAILMGIGSEAIAIRKGYNLPTRGDQGGFGVFNIVSTEADNLGVMLQDAKRHSNRAVAFSRILLNAPQVHSRYNSTFQGTIIAEIAVMSPGEFVYYFDDVFTNPNVELLPLLNPTTILKVK